MDHKTVEDYVLSMPNARLDYPFGEGVAVYMVSSTQKAKNNKGDASQGAPGGETGVNPDAPDGGRGKMFALIQEGKQPVRISLKCDPELSKILREKYEEVMEGYHLNKKHWNTIVLSGQLSWEEIQALIRHSYDLVVGNSNAVPEMK